MKMIFTILSVLMLSGHLVAQQYETNFHGKIVSVNPARNEVKIGGDLLHTDPTRKGSLFDSSGSAISLRDLHVGDECQGTYFVYPHKRKVISRLTLIRAKQTVNTKLWFLIIFTGLVALVGPYVYWKKKGSRTPRVATSSPSGQTETRRPLMPADASAQEVRKNAGLVEEMNSQEGKVQEETIGVQSKEPWQFVETLRESPGISAKISPPVSRSLNVEKAAPKWPLVLFPIWTFARSLLMTGKKKPPPVIPIIGVARGFQSRTEQRASGPGGAPAPYTVWTFRLERVDKQSGNQLTPVPVQMRGKTFEGFINEGDEVQLYCQWREGTLCTTWRVRNLTNGADVVAQQGGIFG